MLLACNDDEQSRSLTSPVGKKSSWRMVTSETYRNSVEFSGQNVKTSVCFRFWHSCMSTCILQPASCRSPSSIRSPWQISSSVTTTPASPTPAVTGYAFCTHPLVDFLQPSCFINTCSSSEQALLTPSPNEEAGLASLLLAAPTGLAASSAFAFRLPDHS